MTFLKENIYSKHEAAEHALIWRLRGDIQRKRGDISGALRSYERYLAADAGILYGDEAAIRALVQQLRCK